MKQLLKRFLLGLIIVGFPVFICISSGYGAAITDGYPGYPDKWEGLTTNTIIVIDLDAPVAMIGDQPDMTYCVKKATFSGFDFVFTDVACDVDVSDDRTRIRLYPEQLLDQDSMYAYKITDINFEGGGADQNFTQCYATGNNPIPLLDTAVSEGDMCSDVGGSLSFGKFCYRCHTDWTPPSCIITP